MNLAIGYIRVSTEKQADEGISLEAQQAQITAWCRANSYELVHVYVDAGVSAKRMDTRRGLLEALLALKKGMALVSYSLSRLARSTKDALTIGEAIAKKKADLVSLSENIDTTSAAGKMMFQMLAVLAEFERNLGAERTTNALQYKKRTNQRYCNQTPYGFEAIGDSLVPILKETEVIAEIRAAREAGITLQSIADRLNNRKTPTKNNKKWQPATIHLLLKRSSLISIT